MRQRLNDEDHRVHAAWQMGHVIKQLTEARGAFTPRFFLAGDDVTQSINRLIKAGMVDISRVKWNVSEILIAQVQRAVNARRKP